MKALLTWCLLAGLSGCGPSAPGPSAATQVLAELLPLGEIQATHNKGDAPARLRVVPLDAGAVLRFEGDARFATLAQLRIPRDGAAIETPWGELTASGAWQSDGIEFGRVWERREGDWAAARENPEGTAKLLWFRLGRTAEERPQARLELRMASMRQGVVYVDDSVELRYPLPGER